MIPNIFDLDWLVVTPVYAIVWAAWWLVPAIASVVGAGISAVSNSKSAKAQKQASNFATRSQQDAIDKQLAWERERDERARSDAERVERENASRWAEEVQREQANNDRLFAEDQHRDRRREPYRVAGREALTDLTARNRDSMRDLPGLGRI